VNETRQFEVRLYDDFERIEVEASIYGDLIGVYKELNKDEQFELADRIERAIGKTARALAKSNPTFFYEKDAVVLINDLPVMFEPINNAMLVGQWEDWEKKKMNIRSQFIEDRDQQRLLLGGLAAFVTYLEQR
jgi:hypothetical protein